ncbi:bifunctional diguanylate cyclase/phosphodiesterase [Bradyrhizobium sp. WD16]|uniref:putative bifunctional diguanylate cyclase/phosphodiesterase n=1 Tax=Bradyrhizobium sp. WD16 TaxID=1521768 RepID=UPI0020A279C6|nr:EAL domain-containing protein [Bradyrhizobium sp. WD16]UTD26582.1 GGDEF-domain containing protein [Bradyrhizobium sp. WD16]
MRLANVKSIAAAAGRLFRIPDDNPDLMRAQFKAFVKQVPLLYFILVTNSLAVCFTFAPLAPAWQSVAIPVALSAFCVVRMVWWLQQGDVPRSDEEVLRYLRLTNRLGVVLAASFVCWGLSLYPYGDAFAKGQVAFYVALTVIGCIFCLMHLRSAALGVTLVVNVPYVVFFFLQGEPTLKAVAINHALVSAAMITVLFIYYRDFADLVASRKTLIAKQAETQALSDENFHLANRDALTELPNRRRFFADLHGAFTAAETAGTRLAVGIIDLDGFKPVNDTYGHTVGDRVLIEAGRRIAEACAGFCACRVLLARLGGDEFGLVICGDPTEDDLLALGRAIGDPVRLPYQLDGAHAAISCSIGFALYPSAADTEEALYECADYALYHAKRHQRGHAVIFSAEHEAQIRSRGIIEHLLQAADLGAEMSLAFQPIVDAATERTEAFEVLARWNNPKLGPVSPGDFIPAAERVGLIGSLTQVLLEKALAAVKTWPDHIRMSFNLSAQDICSPDGVLQLIATVHGSGVPPRRIDFEITETAVAFDFAQAQQAVTALKTIGCGVSLDDFGTGYSSLSHVHCLPLDKIKIDRSFVADINDNAVSNKIVKSLASLCADMDLTCVAEGVETREQLDSLRRLGCDLIQGYYFAKPMPADAVAGYLAREAQKSALAAAAAHGAIV